MGCFSLIKHWIDPNEFAWIRIISGRRFHIQVKCLIWICFKAKRRIRIRIKVKNQIRIRVEVKIRELWTVLRIRDVYPGSRIRLFSIPDPGSGSATLAVEAQLLTKVLYELCFGMG